MAGAPSLDLSMATTDPSMVGGPSATKNLHTDTRATDLTRPTSMAAGRNQHMRGPFTAAKRRPEGIVGRADMTQIKVKDIAALIM